MQPGTTPAAPIIDPARRSRRGWALLLVAALLSAPTSVAWARPPGDAPPRPQAFYILSRRAVPPADPRTLPAEARPIYLRIRQLERELRASRDLADHGAQQRTRIRLSAALDAEWPRLLASLATHRAALDARGWLLYAEAAVAVQTLHHMTAMDRYDSAFERDPDGAGEPPTPDFRVSIAVLRNASARGTTDTAAWARYIEAWCLAEVDAPTGPYSRAAAADTLRVVAAAGPAGLRAEARLRLGEAAFDAGDYPQATGWYRRALPDIAAELRAIVLYKLAWALRLSGRTADARTIAATLPPDAPEDLRTDLAELLP